MCVFKHPCHQDYYQALLSNYNPGLALSPAAKQIELDLLRTLPNNIYYENNHSKGIIFQKHTTKSFIFNLQEFPSYDVCYWRIAFIILS